MPSLVDNINLPKLQNLLASKAEKTRELIQKGLDTGEIKDVKEITKNVTSAYNPRDNSALITNKANKATASVPSRVPGSIANQQTVKSDPGADSLSFDPDQFRVKLVNTLDDSEIVIFKVRPQISENRSVQYDALSLLHHPGEILKYQKTSNRKWSFSAILVSRNMEEAAENLKHTNWIRSWTMPFYGEGTNNSDYSDRLGAPPPILKFSAYGDRMIGPVPVVLESYSITWPDNIDYIQTTEDEDAVPFPVLVTVQIDLSESFSPAEYSGFDLQAYKEGRIEDAYIPVSATGLSTDEPKTSDTSDEEDTASSSDGRRKIREVDNNIDATNTQAANAKAKQSLSKIGIMGEYMGDYDNSYLDY